MLYALGCPFAVAVANEGLGWNPPEPKNAIMLSGGHTQCIPPGNDHICPPKGTFESMMKTFSLSLGSVSVPSKMNSWNPK